MVNLFNLLLVPAQHVSQSSERFSQQTLLVLHSVFSRGNISTGWRLRLDSGSGTQPGSSWWENKRICHLFLTLFLNFRRKVSAKYLLHTFRSCLCTRLKWLLQFLGNCNLFCMKINRTKNQSTPQKPTTILENALSNIHIITSFTVAKIDVLG